MYNLIQLRLMCRSQNIFMKTVRSTFRSVSSLSRTSTSSSLSRSHCLRTTSDAFCAPYSTNLVKSNEGIEYSLMKEWVKEEDLHFAFEGFPKAKYSEMHTVLHPSSDDPTLLCLAEANSMEDVFKIISTREGQLNGNLASQAIVTLWDLQKFYCRWKRPDCSQSDYFKSLREFISVATSHPHFGMLINMLNESAPLLSNEALATVLLCLRRFHIVPWDLSVHSLLCASFNRIEQFQLPELAKWCLSLAMPSHTGRLIIPAALPVLEQHMNSQDHTLEDAKLVSMCFITLAAMIHRGGTLSRHYVMYITSLLDNGTINVDSPIPELITILRALFLASKSTSASSLAIVQIHQLLHKSKRLEDPSTTGSFSWIRKSWEAVSEPMCLMKRLDDLACRRLEEKDVKVDDLVLLSLVLYRNSPGKKQRLEQYLAQMLEVEEPLVFEPYLKQICRIIRHLRITDSKLIERYWAIVRHCLEARKSQGREDFIYQLQDIISWYSFLNLRGNYRFQPFEAQMLDWITGLIDWQQPIVNLRSFCRLSSFVLAFGGAHLPVGLVDKMIELEEQLNIEDVYNLSRSLRLRNYVQSRQPTNPSRPLVNLSLMLDRRTCFILSTSPGSGLNETCHLLNASLHRNSRFHHHLPYGVKMKDTTVHETLMKKYESQLDEVNANFAKDILHFLSRFRYLSFPIVNRLVSFCIEHHESVGASLLIKTFILCFELGYTPPSINQFIPIVGQALNELDSNGLYGLYVLEGALALLLHDSLSTELVQKVFSVRFLEMLDTELLQASERDIYSYPARVRDTLMKLNRAVCLSMPEAGVPWFHEKYCQSRAHSSSSVTSSYQVDIYNCLKEVLGGGQFIKTQAHSPYFHAIDFELLVDSGGRPIPHAQPLDSRNADEAEKIAVLAWLPSDFTAKGERLSGIRQLYQRELEILGYRVVGIPHHHWNSLALSNPQAKCDYIRKKLYKSSSKSAT